MARNAVTQNMPNYYCYLNNFGYWTVPSSGLRAVLKEAVLIGTPRYALI